MILRALFSEFNGIQVFIYPSTILYWVSSSSILLVLTSLLSTKIHFLPVAFYGVLLIYVGFVMMKIYTILFDEPHKRRPQYVSEFWESVIRLHGRLFVAVMIVMVFFVFSEFLSYFYGIKLPVKKAIMMAFRLFTIGLVIVYYIPSIWMKPYRLRLYSQKKSQLLCLGWMRKNPLQAVKYTLILVALLFTAARLYAIVVSYVLVPILMGLGNIFRFNIVLEFIAINGMWSMVYDLYILAAAFMLSNLCFYPIIALTQAWVMGLHPIKLTRSQNV